MAMEFRLRHHRDAPGEQVIEIWIDGKVAFFIYEKPAGDGITIIGASFESIETAVGFQHQVVVRGDGDSEIPIPSVEITYLREYLLLNRKVIITS
jgi:hypothetical protein